MATGKRFYWIKLRSDFMNGDAVDFLMQQPNGANYVVLYLMLVFAGLNSGGKLQSVIGEVIVPYETSRIQRECRFFDAATIEAGLALYKRLGLVYRDDGGSLVIDDFDSLVGSETDYAGQKRAQRKKVDIVHSRVHTDEDLKTEEECVYTPAIDEIARFLDAYAKKQVLNIDAVAEAKAFVNFNSARGWMIGRTPIQDWQPLARKWVDREAQFSNAPQDDNPLLKTKFY